MGTGTTEQGKARYEEILRTRRADIAISWMKVLDTPEIFRIHADIHHGRSLMVDVSADELQAVLNGDPDETERAASLAEMLHASHSDRNTTLEPGS